MKRLIIISEKMSEIMLNIKWVLPLDLFSMNDQRNNKVCKQQRGGEVMEICHVCNSGKITLCINSIYKDFIQLNNGKPYSLGMSLAMKIADLSGGEIRFSDESGNGCSFTFIP
jgi:hypothetical protein